jgi:hypothetical protein
MRQLDKAERLIAQTGQIEEGRVWLPATLDGLDAFLRELRAFPNGCHDDQVDSLTQMLEWTFWNWRGLLEQRLPDGRLKDHGPSGADAAASSNWVDAVFPIVGVAVCEPRLCAGAGVAIHS